MAESESNRNKIQIHVITTYIAEIWKNKPDLLDKLVEQANDDGNILSLPGGSDRPNRYLTNIKKWVSGVADVGQEWGKPLCILNFNTVQLKQQYAQQLITELSRTLDVVRSVDNRESMQSNCGDAAQKIAEVLLKNNPNAAHDLKRQKDSTHTLTLISFSCTDRGHWRMLREWLPIEVKPMQGNADNSTSLKFKSGKEKNHCLDQLLEAISQLEQPSAVVGTRSSNLKTYVERIRRKPKAVPESEFKNLQLLLRLDKMLPYVQAESTLDAAITSSRDNDYEHAYDDEDSWQNPIKPIKGNTSEIKPEYKPTRALTQAYEAIHNVQESLRKVAILPRVMDHKQTLRDNCEFLRCVLEADQKKYAVASERQPGQFTEDLSQWFTDILTELKNTEAALKKTIIEKENAQWAKVKTSLPPSDGSTKARG